MTIKLFMNDNLVRESTFTTFTQRNKIYNEWMKDIEHLKYRLKFHVEITGLNKNLVHDKVIDRERIKKMLNAGLTVNYIANEMSLSTTTIKTIKKEIYEY